MVLASFPALSSETQFMDDYNAIEEASNSVLYLETDDDYDSTWITTGSGFVAFDSKTFITNYHVIEGAKWIRAYDEDEKEYAVGDILAIDEDRDIAILSFKSLTNLKPLKLAQNPDVKRGQPVATIGYPKGLSNTFATGIVSAILDDEDEQGIQFTAPISHGSSGGALFNAQGEVIGITTALIEDGQNINYAVAISHAIDLYKSIRPGYISGLTGTLRPTATPKVTPRPTSSPTPKITAKPTAKPTVKPIISAPQGLFFALGDESVKVYWQFVENAVMYKVYRSYTLGGPFEFMGTVYVATYEDPYVLRGKSYYYKISSVDAKSNESAQSEVLQVTLPTPTPQPSLSSSPTIPPEELAKYRTLTVGMTGQDVARLKERMYELGYFNNRTVNETFTETTAEYVKEFQRVNKLKADGVATPEMQALFFSNNAVPKPSPTQKPTPTPKPQPPDDIKVTLSNEIITLTWSPVLGAVSYNVYLSTKPNGEYYLLGTVIECKYVDDVLFHGLTLYYKIESVNRHAAKSEKSKYVKLVIPKATPTPYIEPRYPLEIGDYAYWDTYGSYISFNPKVVNSSKTKTVDGFTITYFFEDVYGEKIGSYGGSTYYMEVTYSKTVRPNSSTYAGYVKFPEFRGVKYVYAAVTKIHTTDWKTITVPVEYWQYPYWTID